MDKYSPEQLQLLDMWENGKPLNEAIWQFCNKKYKDEYKQINLKQENNYENPTLDGLFRVIQDGVNCLSKIRDAENKLYENLYDKIKKKHLIALGYESSTKSDDAPKLIPLRLWPPEKIDKDKSSVFGSNLEFSSVRIIKKSNLQKTIIKKEILPPKIEIKDKKVGRPSLKKEIIAAYESLKKDEDFYSSQKLKSHVAAIQKRVQFLFPHITTNEGMEHEAIRRAVGEIFKAEKTSKSTSKL